MDNQDLNSIALGTAAQPLWYIQGLDLRPNITISTPAGRRSLSAWWLIGLGLVLWFLLRR